MKRQLREGAFDAGQFEADDKIRRLPVDRSWSPLAHHNDDRDQAYLKTIKAKSTGQSELIKAIDDKNLVLALGPAGTGKTYLATALAMAR
jgi:phosphate starvation-inducible PhoH-like protein